MGSTITLIVSEGQVQVPNVVGMNLEQAQKALTDAGLKFSIVEDTLSLEADGKVIAQNPQQGTNVAPGTSVTLTVARPIVTPPDPSLPEDD
jgi:serine/threonine-protein kinase